MSCIAGMSRIPDGYGLFDKLPMSLPQVTAFKLARLAGMAASEDVGQRCAAAGNPALPVELLVGLAGDVDVSVQSWVARNPKCPVAVLRVFAGRDDELGAFARWRLEENNG